MLISMSVFGSNWPSPMTIKMDIAVTKRTACRLHVLVSLKSERLKSWLFYQNCLWHTDKGINPIWQDAKSLMSILFDPCRRSQYRLSITCRFVIVSPRLQFVEQRQSATTSNNLISVSWPYSPSGYYHLIHCLIVRVDCRKRSSEIVQWLWFL